MQGPHIEGHSKDDIEIIYPLEEKCNEYSKICRRARQKLEGARRLEE